MAAGAAGALVGRPVADPLPQLVVADPLIALREFGDLFGEGEADFEAGGVGREGVFGSVAAGEKRGKMSRFDARAGIANRDGHPRALL